MRHGNTRRSATREGYPPPPTSLVVGIGLTEIAYTLDDNTWLTTTVPSNAAGTTYADCCYAPGKGFLAISRELGSKFIWSLRGTSWSSYNAPTSGVYYAVDYSPTLGMFVACNYTTGKIYRATNIAGPWTASTTTIANVRSVKWLKGRFMAVSASGSSSVHKLYLSSDGNTWTAFDSYYVDQRPGYALGYHESTDTVYVAQPSGYCGYITGIDNSSPSSFYIQNSPSGGAWSDFKDVGTYILAVYGGNNVGQSLGLNRAFTLKSLSRPTCGSLAYSKTRDIVYVPIVNNDNIAYHARSTNKGSGYTNVNRGVVTDVTVMCCSD